MITQLFTNPLMFFTWAVALVVAITIHEFAHAWMANRLGDPTPEIQGRLTLNPLAHLDPIGTIALLLVGFGWGKPVQFDPYNLRNPKKDAMLISLAGPLSNIILAIALSLVIRLIGTPLITLLTPIIFLNIVLAVFNLIPVYPLDGEKILYGLLPRELGEEFSGIMRQYGLIILLFLIWPFAGTPPIARLISPVINAIVSLLL